MAQAPRLAAAPGGQGRPRGGGGSAAGAAGRRSAFSLRKNPGIFRRISGGFEVFSEDF